jgi:glycosyltransferase involved in cell wall biosynthesis
VDDGSRDGTARALEALKTAFPRLRVLTHPTNLGYGKALRDAWAAAGKDYIFFTDVDGQFDPTEIAAFLPLLDGANAAVGYRSPRADGWHRKLVSRGYNALVRCLFGLRVRDIDASFKLFPRRVAQGLDFYSDKFFIDTELMLKLAKAGVAIVERPVKHRPRLAGRSSVSAAHVFTTVGEIIRLRRRI